MSHPNPGHDRGNEYPSDGYTPGSKKRSFAKSRAIKHQTGDSDVRAALKREHKNVKRIMSGDGGLERPIKKMLDLSDVGGKVGAKAQAIKSKLK